MNIVQPERHIETFIDEPSSDLDINRDAEEFLTLKLLSSAFPEPEESLLLPSFGDFAAQELKNLLREPEARKVMGWETWRKGAFLGDRAASLWLSDGTLSFGFVWQKDSLYWPHRITQHKETSQVLLKKVRPSRPRSTEPSASEPNEIEDHPGDVEPTTIEPPRSAVHLRVLAAYTGGAIREIRQNQPQGFAGLTPLAYHGLMLQESTNFTFLNSGIPVSLEVRLLEIPSFQQSLGASKTLEQLVLGREWPYDHIHRQRGQADVVALIGKFGGAGTAGDGNQVPADGFLVVDWEYAYSHFEFAHELGHILGADHQPQMSITQGTKAFARAYCCDKEGWQTVMSRLGTGCTGIRAPLWSSAQSLHGFSHGNARRDNARAILEMASTVDQYGRAAAQRQAS